MSRSALGHRAPLLWLLAPFAAGLIAGKLSPEPLPVGELLTAALGLSLLLLVLPSRFHVSWPPLLGASLALTGAAYYELRRERLPDWDRLPAREAELVVRVVRLFAPAQPDQCSALARVVQASAPADDLVDQPVAVSLRLRPGESRPIRGDLLRVRGVIEPLPRRPPDDDFAAYLVDAGFNFRLSRGRIVQVEQPAGVYRQALERLRQGAAARLSLGLEEHPSLAGALRGMLLGERSGLSAEQEDLYLRSGAMHLFAISGLHIAVIATGFVGLLRALRLRPLGVFLLGSALLWLFVDLTGAQPSAVRAWLMVVCFHGSRVLRAPGNALSALALSAILVLLLDPMQLFGAGFQMSYSIMAAILLYGLPLRERWMAEHRLWPHLPAVSLAPWQRAVLVLWEIILSALAVNWSAALLGTVCSVMFFGLLAPIGIVANLILIPMATGTLLAGLASLLTALVPSPLPALLFNHAAALLLLLMQHALALMVAMPAASYDASFRHPWWGSAALLVLLAVMSWGYTRGWSAGRLAMWLPFAALAAALVLAVRLV